jgi:hypothetical protein
MHLFASCMGEAMTASSPEDALPATATPRVTIGFDPDDYQDLRRIADEQERSVSWIVRKAVRQFLDTERSRRDDQPAER